MQVFRHYDQAALDKQYDGSSRDPHMAPVRDERQKRVEAKSVEVRRTAKAKLDLRYGPMEREKIDVFHAGKANAPLLVYIHGGYWKQRSKDEFAWMAPPFTQRGINFATINYPLAPKVRIWQIVDSCRRALLYLVRNAKDLGFDAGRIHVSGHSAGGHLTAMMMSTDFAKYGAPKDLVKSATCISGLYDLTPLAMVKVNQDLQINPVEVQYMSPLTLEPATRCPLVTTVGDQEAEEFIRNTVELGDAWKKKGVEVTSVPAPGFYHFNILDTFAEEGRPLHEHVVKTIG